jgi:hypothetical protein
LFDNVTAGVLLIPTEPVTATVLPTVAFTVGVPLMPTFPLTGTELLVTVTGILGVGGAAAIGTRLGLAPTVPVPIRTATIPSTARPIDNDRIFFSGYIVSPPSSF